MLRRGHRQNLGGAQRGESLAALVAGGLPSRTLQLDLKTEKEKVEGKGVQIFVFEDCGQ